MALQAKQNGTSDPADRSPDRLTGLDREAVALLQCPNRLAELAGVDSRPPAHHEQLTQQAEAPLSTQGGGRAVHELDRLGDITCCVCRKSQQLGPRRIPVVDAGSLTNPRANSSRGVDWRRQGQDFQTARIEIVVRDLRYRLGYQCLCLSTGIGPPA